VEKYLSAILRLLTVSCKEYELKTRLFLMSHRIIVYIIANLLRLTEKDSEDLQESPETYVSEIYNIATLQTDDSLPGYASHLLYSLSTHIDGALAFAVELHNYLMLLYIV
jgi:hypothetical protein